MISDNPYQKYKNTQVMTADQRSLLIMLLEGCSRFIKQGRLAMEEKKFEEANKSCIKAEKIVMELINSLDLSYGDFTKNLLAIYEYIYRRLVESNLQKDISILLEAQKLFSEIEQMWKEVYAKALVEEKSKLSEAKKSEEGISKDHTTVSIVF